MSRRGFCLLVTALGFSHDCFLVSLCVIAVVVVLLFSCRGLEHNAVWSISSSAKYCLLVIFVFSFGFCWVFVIPPFKSRGGTHLYFLKTFGLSIISIMLPIFDRWGFNFSLVLPDFF
jgi:FtsH-binding integral membrane protein